MKIIHCADLHLDSKMLTNLSKEQAKERKMEILRTFTRMIEFGEKQGVSVVLIAGDLFDTRNVSATARNLVRDTIVSHPNMDFLYLKGNHDSDNFLSKLETIPENLKMFGDTWRSYSYGKVVFSGIELSKDNQATVYNSLVLDHDVFNVVTMHGQLADYKSKDQVETISLNDLKNKNIDYLALGHVHDFKMDQLDARGIYCYSGCMEGRGFDECGEKGFVLIDINEDTLEAKLSFAPIASRTLYALDVDVSGVMTTQEAAVCIEKKLVEVNYPSKSMVKIVLTGEVDVECEINLDFLKDMFADYFFFEKVSNHTKMLVNYSDYEKDESLKGEFIRMVMKSDLSEERKSEVIRCGIMALSGEEI